MSGTGEIARQTAAGLRQATPPRARTDPSQVTGRQRRPEPVSSQPYGRLIEGARGPAARLPSASVNEIFTLAKR
jgi:hypothetical protein